jgi:hypothetical protein
VCAEAWAQSSDHVEIFGGYSFAAYDFTGGQIPPGALSHGWNAALNLKVKRPVGIVFDFGQFYNHNSSPGTCNGGRTSCSSKAFTAMFGPQFSFPLSRVTPFAHALFGIAHASQNGTFEPFQGNNSAAMALGGGVDFYITRHFGLRGQADYLRTWFAYNDNQLTYSFNNNARISAGAVFRF